MALVFEEELKRRIHCLVGCTVMETIPAIKFGTSLVRVVLLCLLAMALLVAIAHAQTPEPVMVAIAHPATSEDTISAIFPARHLWHALAEMAGRDAGEGVRSPG
jgi:hypothetical protein